jgi:hypothetical protein
MVNAPPFPAAFAALGSSVSAAVIASAGSSLDNIILFMPIPPFKNVKAHAFNGKAR